MPWPSSATSPVAGAQLWYLPPSAIFASGILLWLSDHSSLVKSQERCVGVQCQLSILLWLSDHCSLVKSQEHCVGVQRQLEE